MTDWLLADCYRTVFGLDVILLRYLCFTVLQKITRFIFYLIFCAIVVLLLII